MTTINQRSVRRWNEQAGKMTPRSSRAAGRHPTKRDTPGRQRHFSDISRRLALRSHMARLWSALLGRLFMAWGPAPASYKKRTSQETLLRSLFSGPKQTTAFGGKRERARRLFRQFVQEHPELVA